MIKKLLLSIIFIIAALIILVVIGLYLCTKWADTYQKDNRISSAPQTGKFVDAGDTRLFVQRSGDTSKTAIVFIHGTGSWSGTWKTSMNNVVELGYQAIAIDMPPFGYSLPPASKNYLKTEQAKRLLAALDSMNIKQAIFVAHSFGAAPVMEALMTEPNRAIKLILIDAALGLDSAKKEASNNFLQDALKKTWLSEPLTAAFLTNPYFTHQLIQSFISEKDKATDEWVTLYQQPLSLTNSYQSIARWIPYLLENRSMGKSDDINEYKKIKYPVVLIWGETDTITPLSQAEHLQALIPQSKLLNIPHAGHIPQIEETEKFQMNLKAALLN